MTLLFVVLSIFPIIDVQNRASFTAKVAAAAFAGANGSSGLPAGLDRLLGGFSEAPGIPYLTEMVLSFEGNAQMAEAMRKMGQMKITSRVTGVSVEPLPDALFSVPPDYTVVKK